MGFFGMGKRVKNKTFDYIPQHYDRDEEELKAKFPGLHRDMNDIDATKMRIRSGLRSKSRGSKEIKKKGEKAANIRLLIIVFILVLISYYFIKSTIFEELMNSLL